MTAKVWFITGSSRGFGYKWAEAALARGDRVAATARNPDTLKDLVEKYGYAEQHDDHQICAQNVTLIEQSCRPIERVERLRAVCIE